MNTIVLAGGSGFLGAVLAEEFTRSGASVVVLTRSPRGARPGIREAQWDGRQLGDWAGELDGAQAVINLTGKSVNCRYTKRNRAAILESRVHSTRVIGEAIARCRQPPEAWLNASTATIYRHSFDRAWDESGEIASAAEAKDEFSVQVAKAWERALEDARTPGTRKIPLRLSMVLGLGQNSVFPVLQRLVRLGLGGRMASGRQYVSWIHERDFCRAVRWLIEHRDIAGPVNVCAPAPLTNAEMMACLRRIYSMPVGLPGPRPMLEIGAFLLRTETELIIKSRRVIPVRLLESGFQFEFPSFADAAAELRARSRSQKQR